MKGLCRLGFHKARKSEIWNGGYYFSRCVRCDQDMIRRPDEDWQAVPPGHHIVWRPGSRRVAYVVPRPDSHEKLPALLGELGTRVD